MTPTNSWLFTDTSRAALFDELVKIGSAAEKDVKRDSAVKNALKTGLSAAGGVGAGYLAGEGLTRAAEHFWPGSIKPKKPIPGRGTFRHRMLTIGLPIGAGVGATLWSRANQKRRAKLRNEVPEDASR